MPKPKISSSLVALERRAWSKPGISFPIGVKGVKWLEWMDRLHCHKERIQWAGKLIENLSTKSET
jgi:hypothetical protein